MTITPPTTPGHDLPRADSGRDQNRGADNTQQRAGFANATLDRAQECVHPSDRLRTRPTHSRIDDRDAIAGFATVRSPGAALGHLAQRRRTAEPVDRGPNFVAADLARVSKVQKSATGQGHVQEVATGAAEDFFGHDHPKRDPNRYLPQRNRSAARSSGNSKPVTRNPSLIS